MAKKSFGIWTFVIGGVVGAGLGYMGREEIARIIQQFKGQGGGTAARARRIQMAQRARLRAMGYAV